MKNSEEWRPTKYVLRGGTLLASRDPEQVAVASRLIIDCVARLYGECLPLHARGRLLDLGCGTVPLYGVYRWHVWETVCVDWSNTMHVNYHLDFECDLTKPLPFADDEFHTIILSDVLEHIPEPELLWNEMARILAPNGKLLLSVPFFYWVHEAPYDYYRYTSFALRRFAERSGLKLLRLDPLGGAPEVLADIFSKNVIRLPLVGRSIAEAIQWGVGAFVKTRFGARISAATAENFPLGYFLIAGKA